MSSFKRIAILSVCIAVSACGFRPLYAPPAEDVSGGSVYAFEELKAVEVALLPDRDGQYLRNKLVRLLQPEGRARVTKYGLQVSFSENKSSLDVQQSAVATRANLSVTANFSLVALSDGRAVHTGNVRATGGYNIFDSEFQTLIAEQGARERALDSIAEQIRIRIATALTTGAKGS